MGATEELESRVRVLEEISSHQEYLLRELNTTVFQLRGELDRLEALYRRQQERLERLGGSSQGEDAPAHDPPPHY